MPQPPFPLKMVINMTEPTVVILGAGHAGGELAVSLRQNGHTGRIILIGAEPYLPYQRPPLSKTFLSGEVAAESLLLRPAHAYESAHIEFTGGSTVQRIDRENKSVHLDDGSVISYDKLALTTGGRPRGLSLPGIGKIEDLSNHYYVRTIDDVNNLRMQFKRAMRMVIVGGGYIGLEVAAVAVKHGLEVTVVEALPRVLARVTAPEISTFYQQIHREAGVSLHLGVEITGVELNATRDRISSVNCFSSETRESFSIPADLVVVGIGLIPNTELAENAGLMVDNGIVVDELAQTSDPHIVAAGDCTNQPNAILGRRIRLESVPNALEQARTAAATLCGKSRPYTAVPWFWSDQYDLKLQMVGMSLGYDALHIRGSVENRSFAAFYLKEGRLLAVDCVNRPAEFMAAKRMVAARVQLAPADLVDESIPIKQLLLKSEA